MSSNNGRAVVKPDPGGCCGCVVLLFLVWLGLAFLWKFVWMVFTYQPPH